MSNRHDLCKCGKLKDARSWQCKQCYEGQRISEAGAVAPKPGFNFRAIMESVEHNCKGEIS